MTMIRTFLNDETGAATIDWVALTAGILLVGIAVVYAIFSGGVAPLVTEINSELQSETLGMACTADAAGVTTCAE